MTRLRLLLADDHAITREGTRELLEREPDLEIVGEAADGEEAVRLAAQLRPDILLLDVSMPRLNGLEVTQRVRQHLPETRIVVLTGYENEQYARVLVRLGVAGYLSKAASFGELVAALRAAGAGHVALPPAIAALLRPQAAALDEAPTPRELEVLSLVAAGLRNRAIAQRLVTSERTVQFHLGNLFAKLGASSRTELVHLARQRGWIP